MDLKGVFIGIAAAVLCAVSFEIGRRWPSERPQSATEIKYDTLLIFDTIREFRPVFVEKRIVDTVKVDVPGDTVFVRVPIEQRRYEGDGYRAWVSGYRPQLDSINIYKCERIVEKTVTRTEPRGRWSLGVVAGYGVSVTAEPRFAPYVGIGVSYSLLSW